MTPDQTRDECDDLAAILRPSPPRGPHSGDPEAFQAGAALDAQRARDWLDAQLRVLRDDAHQSPVLATLREQARIKADADRTIREVVAYAREFVAPRPYTLEALAEAIGTSYSTVRGAFDHHDVEAVAEATGRRHTLNQQPVDPAGLEQLVADLRENTAAPAREFVTDVAAVLSGQGWTPYPPVARTPNPRTAKRYIRWERRWPNGTKVGLYQEPTGVLSTHARMPASDVRYFLWENDDEGAAAALADELARYAERIAQHDVEKKFAEDDEQDKFLAARLRASRFVAAGGSYWGGAAQNVLAMALYISAIEQDVAVSDVDLRALRTRLSDPDQAGAWLTDQAAKLGITSTVGLFPAGRSQASVLQVIHEALSTLGPS